jgi:phage terminase large subunit-like protein
MLVGIDLSIKRRSVDQPFFDQQRFERLDSQGKVRRNRLVSVIVATVLRAAMSPVVAAPLAVKEPLRVVFIRYSSPRFPHERRGRGTNNTSVSCETYWLRWAVSTRSGRSSRNAAVDARNACWLKEACNPRASF